METSLYPEFFNDVFGPVMQPGSSSHTAGPCRLGYLAHSLLGENPRRIQIILDQNSSFAGTFGLMAEDSAMIAGALGMLPDDPRLYQARSIARKSGIDYSFVFTEMKESDHPNAVKFILSGESGREITLVGDSTGGGMVETRKVGIGNQTASFSLRVKGDSYVTMICDLFENIQEDEIEKSGSDLVGLVEMGRRSESGNGCLYYFCSAEPPNMADFQMRFAGKPANSVLVGFLKPVLPVITRPERKPQLFNSMAGWRKIAQERNLPLWEIAVQYEMDASGWTRQQVIDFMRMIAAKMHRQTHAPYEEGADGVRLQAPYSPFKPDMAGDWDRYQQSGRQLTDDLTSHTIRLAYGAGAGIPGVEVVAGPMGSGGGYIYAALYAVQQASNRVSPGFSEQDLLRGLFIAAGIGAIAFTRTEPTGERTGCTGECGICGAMAAAAIAEMAGGTPEQVENAASLSLQSATGIPCDPIHGGFGQPCRSRIITATCMASVFADLALSGRNAVLPLHEAIDVADAVGRRLPPELLCTSLGGAAQAPSARKQALEFRTWYDQTEQEGTLRPPGNLI